VQQWVWTHGAQLGDFYSDQYDYATAAKHYLRSALCGDAHSQDELAKLYELGRGVKKDFRRAWLWIRIAHEVGRTDESVGVRMMNYQRQVLLPDLGYVDDAFALWAVRRPDQTVTCETESQVAETEFRNGLFLLN